MKPLYQRRESLWVPDEYTQGPYPGSQHAGATGGLLAAGLEALAAEEGAGIPLMFSMVNLRPAPLSPAERKVEVVRAGGRVLTLKGSLSFDGKLTATATALFAQPVPALNLPPIPPVRLDPLQAGRDTRFDDWPGKVYAHVIEFRRESEGWYWMHPSRPLLEDTPPLARISAMADFAPGISMISNNWDFRDFVEGFPTLDLTLHLARPLEGEWIGIKARTIWYDNGLGLTETELLDIRGPLGRCAQSIVILPKKEGG